MSTENEKSLIYLPDLAVLSQRTAKQLKEQHEERWGHPAEGVVLPICSARGIPFKNDYTTPEPVRYADKLEPFFLGKIVEKFAELGLDIYFSLDPNLTFIKSDLLHVIDIVGDGSPQACFSKNGTRDLLKYLIGKAIEIGKEACKGKKSKVIGIALDLTNILPMGATNERIELTCFCSECREQLAPFCAQDQQLIEKFETFPNPWNMVLKDSGTGIGQISDIEWNTGPQKIFGLSKLKGFMDFENDNPLEKAGSLIAYLQARHKQVVKSTKDIFTGSDQGKQWKRILITEGSSYDWTSGLFLQELDDPAICDELWFDPTSRSFEIQNICYRSFMWRRGTYFLNAFFSFLSKAQDGYMRTYTGLAKRSQDDIKELLKLRMRQVIGASITQKIDLLLLPKKASNTNEDSKNTGRIGFVSPGIDERICASLIKEANIPAGILDS